MVAEDHIVNMNLIKIILKNKYPNAQISEAKNGKIAVQIYQESTFDIIFMDVQMPEMNGYDATTLIREYELSNKGIKRTPVIALTAGAITSEREKCLAVGMDDFLSKPINKTELDRVLSEWLNR